MKKTLFIGMVLILILGGIVVAGDAIIQLSDYQKYALEKHNFNANQIAAIDQGEFQHQNIAIQYDADGNIFINDNGQETAIPYHPPNVVVFAKGFNKYYFNPSTNRAYDLEGNFIGNGEWSVDTGGKYIYRDELQIKIENILQNFGEKKESAIAFTELPRNLQETITEDLKENDKFVPDKLVISKYAQTADEFIESIPAVESGTIQGGTSPPPTRPLSEQERAQASALGINLENMNVQETRKKLEKLTRFSSTITSKRDFVIDSEIIKELDVKEGVYTDPLTGWQAVIKKNDQGNLFVERLLNRPEGVDLNAKWQLPTSDSRGNRIEGYYVNSETGDAWDINGETDWAHTRTFDKWLQKNHPVLSNVMAPGDIARFVSVLRGIAGTVGDWRGLSTNLAPDLTKTFVDFSDKYFGRELQLSERIMKDELIGTELSCEYDDRHSADIPGQSSLFIEGAGGTYQFVAALQAERSAGQTPILCNDDPEIKEEDRCPGELVCKDQLCYDNEDAEKPEAGYFYKIIWGVTAPQDQAYTPYVDEDGQSVKFNIKFKGASDWLYEREDGSAGDEVIELNNGAKDQGVILDYSQKIHNEACIIFSEKYRPEDRSGDLIEREFCVTIKVAAPGAVEFETEDAEEKKPSATVSSGRVRGRSIFERSS